MSIAGFGWPGTLFAHSLLGFFRVSGSRRLRPSTFAGGKCLAGVEKFLGQPRALPLPWLFDHCCNFFMRSIA